MKQLRNREIVLGVSGSIAAYKSADLVRRFQEAGAGVTCVLTPSAVQFITPLTLSALSGRPAHHDILDLSVWNMAHLALARQADAVVVAPCTAHLVSQLAAGSSGDLLSALILTTRAPVFLAPAMHEPMWTHPATQRNVETCRSYGHKFIGPVKGPLASGDEGWGRMEEPVRIVEQVAAALQTTKGKRHRAQSIE
jgi:phosphopantothenoylcysteine decarboxylase/phosphopantothenate--cysteine ligase